MKLNEAIVIRSRDG